MKFFFKPYWDLPLKPIGTLIELSGDMIAKYKADAGIRTAAGSIVINTVMNEPESGIQALGTLYKSRNQESAERTVSGTNLRPAASESYAKYFNSIELAVNFTPNDVLINLFKNIDEWRKKNQAIILKRKVKVDNKKKYDFKLKSCSSKR